MTKPILVALLLSTLVLAGCSHNTYQLGQPLVAETLPQKSEGKELAEVLALLGPPQHISELGVGFVLAWEHLTIQERKLGFSLGFAGASLINVDWGRANVEGQQLLVTFDKNHRVTGRAFTDFANEVGGGQSVQPLASFVGVVSIRDLRQQMAEHALGAQSLSELPETLNYQNSLSSGQNGLQQRGTPSNIGQHSLEFD